YRWLFREEIAGVKPKAQVLHILAGPAEIPPETLRLELAEICLEPLHFGDVLLTRIPRPHIGLQLLEPVLERGEVGIPVYRNQVAQEPPRRTLVRHLIVVGRNPVQVLPDIPVLAVAVVGREIALLKES